ncbi:2Fe-2S iron-sulfur cluster binding domain-containing protein [Pseudomonas sp. MAP12]|uniref:2Fe-2S iron-sulfur cluster binding domain-containing protein n=1 Tax=Geopseudomonas aromaticivorans TaxID=2849492 RepID=A0ABS6MUC7_9GAMM|nr:2Fe-2S iron-sulfur cluster binding domain-containing protein [Pseudomonas aromaticivorans]MBV2132411.1 2Fe-2S iron-sulfur cluster binding domain-containing protein [Pseudomonas aromaticivorans]
MDQSFRITETHSGTSFSCSAEQTVLAAMEQQQQRCVPVGCRGGGCGQCKVQVLSGEYDCGRMSSRHVDAAAQASGQALACRLFPRSDLAIERLVAAGAAR